MAGFEGLAVGRGRADRRREVDRDKELPGSMAIPVGGAELLLNDEGDDDSDDGNDDNEEVVSPAPPPLPFGLRKENDFFRKAPFTAWRGLCGTDVVVSNVASDFLRTSDGDPVRAPLAGAGGNGFDLNASMEIACVFSPSTSAIRLSSCCDLSPQPSTMAAILFSSSSLAVD